MKNIKTILIFILLKILEIGGLILLIIFSNKIGKMLIFFVGEKPLSSNNIIMNYMGYTIVGIICITVMVCIFIIAIHPFLKFVVKKNWEWAKAITKKKK